MGGRRKFSELTEHFTPEDRKIVEEKKAKMRASLKRPSKPSEWKLYTWVAGNMSRSSDHKFGRFLRYGLWSAPAAVTAEAFVAHRFIRR